MQLQIFKPGDFVIDRRFLVLAFALTVTFLLISSNTWAADPAAKCEADKVKAIGKHVACRAKAEAKAAKKGLPTDPIKLAKCDAKLEAAWGKAHGKGAGQCADPPGADFAVALATGASCSTWAAEYAQGSGDPDICASACSVCADELATCQADQAQCQNDLDDCEAQATTWTAITPVTLINAGAGGTGPELKDHSGYVPVEATHGVFRATMQTNGLSEGSINWFGINGNPSRKTERMFNTIPGTGGSVRTIVLPFGPNQTSKWDAGVDSGSHATLEIVGYMTITDVDAAEN